ncbi:5-methyltetrahydropteroyltriglutamate--homocysteine S-methyltransferase [Hyphococcus luteus]|uniref:5-methyltetrahydropteroyltriglutamate--homocysteine S-methyltransferase n=1 Tax=Hyphococcus luteus TaxID=2058213 RepID=A0A2S7K342_9PROT|nr:5-methyltetrahydropteroyltriglutamate--homocysteine S-methyltransferase [Marinicaulis flavus]PQA86922.1 5-methyltetrahydropteroyltriglutamate--homocysteine S-methyltransferase [Marinicaulis flavus]
MKTPPFRADHVGSFLRPKELTEARAQFKSGDISAAELRAVEDEAIKGVVKFQEELGLKGITDGEYRRRFFHVDFLTQLDGVVEEGGMSKKFQNAKGEVDFAPPAMKVNGKVRHSKPVELENFKFLKSITKQTPKVTIPSPTMLHFRGGRNAVDETAYPDMEEFYADVAKAYQEEITALADAGCAYLQLDDTNLAYLCDPEQREGARQRGEDPDELPRMYAKWINEAIKTKPDNMRVAIHLCRGNFKSSWAAEGGYEPVAEVLFNELGVDGYFLEYDDDRSGDFRPLRFVPKGKTVVLGLVSTKLGELEKKEDIVRRIHEAAEYADLDQLALSPQCGFSSTEHGNDILVEQQAAKMRFIIDVVNDVWGGF